MNTKPPLVFSYMRVGTWRQIKGPQPRCIIYARSACIDEADPLLNRQVALCKKLIADKGWVLSRTILEPGISGTKLNRPGLFEVLSEIMRGTADVVVVVRRDRLSRSISDLTAIEASIEVNGGLVVSCTEPCASPSAIGMLIRSTLDMVASLEAKVMKERIRAGMLDLAKQGLWTAGTPPYGYRYDKTAKVLQIVTREASVVRRIFEETAAGRSLGQILEGLRAAGIRNRKFKPRGKRGAEVDGAPAPRFFLAGQLARLIANPAYRGAVRAWNPECSAPDSSLNPPAWVDYPSKHQSIVSDELWRKANKCLSMPKSSRPSQKGGPHHE